MMHFAMTLLCTVAAIWLAVSALMILAASFFSWIDVSVLGAPPLISDPLIATGRRPQMKSFSVVTEPLA